MTEMDVSEELLNAYLDGEVEGPLKDEVAKAIAKNPELLAKYLALSAANQRLVALRDHADTVLESNDNGVDASVLAPKTGLWQRLRPFALAATLFMAAGLGFFVGEQTSDSADTSLAGTWIYRATGAHQLASVKEAWTPLAQLEEIPAVFDPLLAEYRGEDALLELGYEPVGWRAAGDGHAPVALQIIYRKPSGELATAFIRTHVEGGQSSASIEINGIPAYFSGANNVDSALIGLDLPYRDEDWQRLARQPRQG